ncbi:hypothetical protein [Gordonia sputi]
MTAIDDDRQSGRATTSVPEAARVLGVDVRTVRARIARGDLAGGAIRKRSRSRWFVYTDALEASAAEAGTTIHLRDRVQALHDAQQRLQQACAEFASVVESLSASFDIDIQVRDVGCNRTEGHSTRSGRTPS